MQNYMVGAYSLLASTIAYWQTLDGSREANFRFYHLCTDEVYGGVEEAKSIFIE